MPEVSVVVPFYNVERYLGTCIESLRRQSHTDLEIILVDDESTDRSTAIAEQAAAQDRRIRYVRQPNRGPGPGGGRNGGLPHATGEFLMFVDGDDVVPRTAIERLRSSIGSNQQIAMATGGVHRLHGARVLPSRLHDRSHLETKTSTLRDSPELVFDPSAWNKLFRRKHFDLTVRQFPEQVLYEDMVASMASFSRAERISVLSQPIYAWRVRDDGSSITQDQSSWRHQVDRFDQLERLVDLLREDGLAETQRWLDWKIVAIDLAYTHRALAQLPEEDACRLFDATNDFLDRVELATPAHLEAGILRILDALRSRDFEQYRSTLKQHKAPIRPDRTPTRLALQPNHKLVAKVCRITAGSDHLMLDLRIPRSLKNAMLSGSAPVPLAGGSTVWQTELRHTAPGWARAQIDAELACAHLGETQLEVRGLLNGQATRGEIERSDVERALSIVRPSSFLSHGVVTTTTFFEDGQLHLWSSELHRAISTCSVSDRDIVIRITGAGDPPALLLSALLNDDEYVATAVRDPNGATYSVPRDKLSPGTTYALATVDDQDDPLPNPIEVLPKSMGRCIGSPRGLHSMYSLGTGARGQAMLRVGSATPLGAARKIFKTRRQAWKHA